MAGPMDDFLQYVTGNASGGFNPYAAGDKRYGAAGSSAPNTGRTSNLEGYRERDLTASTRRNAMLRKMKAMQQGKYMRSDALRNLQPGNFRI